MSSHKHQVLVIGAGCAGITVAASLRRRAPRLDIALVEPAAHHYYQPAFTLVGAGQYPLEATRRDTRSLIPGGVTLIPAAVTAFRPQANSLDLDNGDSCSYEWLVVATGIGLDLERIEGLREALGANGVCSNYSPAHVEYTWRCLQDLQAGARAVFTQPPLPFKCPGAPQKAAYLSADLLHREGKLASCTVEFYAHGPVIFGVPYFARELGKVAARYNISTNFQHNLVSVDGPAKRATFEIVGGERQGERIEVGFDMLHVSPPQSPPAAVKNSELANAAGWVEVDQNKLRHTRFANIFSLGDVCSTPNSNAARDGGTRTGTGLRRIRLVPADHRHRQMHHGGIHLWRKSHADAAAQPGPGAPPELVDQENRPAAFLLALHAQGIRAIPAAQHGFHGRLSVLNSLR